MINIAFAGLRHGHIFALYQAAMAHPELNVIGAWEECPEAAAQAADVVKVPFYSSYEALLADERVDIVAVGDYYGIRGQRIIQALKSNRPVISDKPLCTSLQELDEIETLSREKQLPVGCMLDLREDGALQSAAAFIQSGQIGTVRALHFTGQHPLNYGVRPMWYFEDGKHGGTFNDIAIHALDAVKWMTGSAYDRTLFARQWNAYAEQVPAFADSGHFSGLLENGAAVTGDVSYAAPAPSAFLLPSYWRFTVWGSRGFVECRLGAAEITVACTGDAQPRSLPAKASGITVLENFLAEVRAHAPGKNTDEMLQSARKALQLQAFANQQSI